LALDALFELARSPALVLVPVPSVFCPGLLLGRGLAPGRGLVPGLFCVSSAIALGLPIGLTVGRRLGRCLLGFALAFKVLLSALLFLIDLSLRFGFASLGVGPNSFNVNSSSLFLSSFFKAVTAASISLRDNLPSLLASSAVKSCDGLGLALTIVGPEVGRGESSLGGLDFEVEARSRSSATIGLDSGDFLTLGLPLGLFWAKPVMAKLNPNISVITVLFIILTSIVTFVTFSNLLAIGDYPFRKKIIHLIDWSTF